MEGVGILQGRCLTYVKEGLQNKYEQRPGFEGKSLLRLVEVRC
jgi:hypothetical protein